ncbi:DUF4112 domain-containing protein [Candidatus Pacebacteria bacterium]|nr:DUF4112 domain-containing protein [Candidatus Paceibacterota bacterium]
MDALDLERLEKIRNVAKVMDGQFSFLGIRFGLDSIIGLFPVVGDILGGLISLYILYQSHLMGIPQSITGKMLIYIIIDVWIGGIPVIGDMFDVFFRVNQRNVRMVERYVEKYSVVDAHDLSKADALK